MKTKPVPLEVRKRSADLRRELERHNRLYYERAIPEISDQEYDGLLRELREIEKSYPSLATDDSPTRKVGGAASKHFRNVTHRVPMLHWTTPIRWMN